MLQRPASLASANFGPRCRKNGRIRNDSRIPSGRCRPGFGLMDLMVTLFVIALAMGLIIPTLQSLRASERDLRCEQNLSRIGQSLHAYANANGGKLPPFVIAEAGWITHLLPFLGETEIYDSYRWDHKWSDPENAPAVSQRIATTICPNGPRPDRMVLYDDPQQLRGGPTDYIGLLITIAVRDLFPEGFDHSGILAGGNINEVPDGLENTGMVFESADKPNVWQGGVLTTETELSPGGAGLWAGFASNGFRGYTKDGKIAPGPCAVNCNNQTGIYAFHPGGANILMGDGRVRFVSDNISVWMMYALISRNGGEIIGERDY